MDKPLKHIDQDTKWTRLIAVCKRTFTCMHFTYLHGTFYYKQVRRRRVRQVVRTVNKQINKELAKCYVCIIFQGTCGLHQRKIKVAGTTREGGSK